MARRIRDVEVVERRWRGHRVVHQVVGDGPETVVLLHGLLLPAAVNGPLTDAFVAAGYRVVLPELLGHGASDAPVDPSCYRMDAARAQVVDLLDDLELDRVVLGGMSLGANVSLKVAIHHPERVAGIICEMPVLERGAIGVMASLAPLWAALRLGSAPLGALFRTIRRLPVTGIDLVDTVVGCAGEPLAMASLLQGYISGPAAPPRELREQVLTPALVIAHGRDWMHPLDDAEALARELPNAQLVEARHFLELRTRPGRLCARAVTFVDEIHGRVASPAA